MSKFPDCAKYCQVVKVLGCGECENVCVKESELSNNVSPRKHTESGLKER